MPERICPNCKSKLGSYDYYFCSVCGNELPKNLVKPGNSIVQLLTLESKDEAKVKVEERMASLSQRILQILSVKEILFILILLVVIGVPSFVWISNLNSFKPEPQKQETSKQNIKAGTLLKTSIDFKSQVFGADFIYSYIPYDIDVFVEANDFESFAKLYSKFDPGYQDMLTKLVPAVDPHFAMYLKKSNEEYVWTLIIFPYQQLKDEDLKVFEQYSWLKLKIVDKALVISVRDTGDQVKNAKAKIDKNLSLNPKFVNYRNEMTKTGKIMIMSFTVEGNKYMENTLSSQKFPEEIKKLLDMYNKSSVKNVVFN